MKRKAIVSLSIVVIIIFGLTILLILYSGYADKKYVKRYHDIEIYSQQKYLDKDEFGDRVYHTGVGAKYFLPKYDEIEYNYSDINFCIFDGTATMTYTAVSFVLDLKFNDKVDYESAKQNELSTRNFMAEDEGKRWHEKNPEFELGDFVCKTVSDSKYPRCFGLLCFNENKSVLRYLYFQEWESDYIKNAEYIKSCSNCTWD